MKKLVKGIVDFREKSLADYREKFSSLVYGQSPDSLFIACCDSRVVPNVFASSDPGDLFVLRNIGNLVPPYCDENEEHVAADISVAATIEFSLKNLSIRDIIICGHSECAAMQFFTQPRSETPLPFVNEWLQYALPAYEKFKELDSTHEHRHLQPHNLLSQINVLQQLEHVKTYPWVKERLEANTLRLHAWWFELANADVYQYENEEGDFILIDKDHAKRILDSL